MSLGRIFRPGLRTVFRRAGQEGLHRVWALLRREEGVSAIEFGLIAPLLFFSLLAMTDIGFALHDRIRIDHVLRSGAQPAMRDAGEVYVLGTLQATARESYTVADAGGPDTIALEVERFCMCRTTPTTEEKDTTCSSTCPEEPTRFYSLSASKSYQGIFLPEIAFAPSVLVQVR